MATFVNLDTIQRAATGSVMGDAWMDQINDNDNVLWGDLSQVLVTPITNVIALGAPWPQLYVRKVGSVVHIQGVLKNNTGAAIAANTTFANLPSSTYYPPIVRAVEGDIGLVFCRINIFSSGAMQVTSSWANGSALLVAATVYSLI